MQQIDKKQRRTPVVFGHAFCELLILRLAQDGRR